MHVHGHIVHALRAAVRGAELPICHQQTPKARTGRAFWVSP